MRITDLLDKLGNPQESLKFIRVNADYVIYGESGKKEGILLHAKRPCFI